MYLGFIEVMVSPDLDLTNSLLMKRPRGWVYLRPFGAVSSTKRSDMLRRIVNCLDTGENLEPSALGGEAL